MGRTLAECAADRAAWHHFAISGAPNRRAVCPDRVEVVAAVWIGRENFGDAKSLDRILGNRDLAEAEYDQAIALLRGGMEHNWTRAQYLQAIDGKPNSRGLDSVRATLTANPQMDQHPELMNRIVQKMLDSLTEKSEKLKKAKNGAPSRRVQINFRRASAKRTQYNFEMKRAVQSRRKVLWAAAGARAPPSLAPRASFLCHG